MTVKLTVQNRQAKCTVIPSAAALVIKALKEPVRDRKKVRGALQSRSGAQRACRAAAFAGAGWRGALQGRGNGGRQGRQTRQSWALRRKHGWRAGGSWERRQQQRQQRQRRRHRQQQRQRRRHRQQQRRELQAGRRQAAGRRDSSSGRGIRQLCSGVSAWGHAPVIGRRWALQRVQPARTEAGVPAAVQRRLIRRGSCCT